MSQNLYWLGADSTSYRELTHLAPTLLKASASSARVGDMVRVKVELSNTTATSSLANKLTLLNAGDKTRILPAYFTDNYISLLPGEMRTVKVEYPATVSKGVPEIAIRGWNATPQSVAVQARR